MAKITSFEEIQPSSLNGGDVFHIIDFENGELIGSRKLTYNTLSSSLKNVIGLKAINNISVDNPNKILFIDFAIKDGSSKTISIDLSCIVNIYEGDDKYIKIDDNTNKINLELSAVSQNLALSSYGLVSYGTQLSVRPYTGTDGIKINDYSVSISDDYLTSNALDNLSGNWESAWSVVSGINGHNLQTSNLAISSLSDLNLKTLAHKEISDLTGTNIIYDSKKQCLSVAKEYQHPTTTAISSDLYKLSFDSLGHVSQSTKVTSSDITALGIPGTDTTYSVVSSGLSMDNNQISLKIGDNLSFDAEGKLQANDSYVLPTATSSDLGGIKVGFTVDKDSKKYPVQLDGSSNAYVSVDWTGTTYTFNENMGISCDDNKNVSIRLGENLTFDDDGKIKAPAADSKVTYVTWSEKSES